MIREIILWLIVGLLFLIGISDLVEAAENEVDFMCCSYHIDREAGYNERNVGWLYKHKLGNHLWVNAGQYKNSDYRTSRLIGLMYRHKLSQNWDLDIYADVLTGYNHPVIGHSGNSTLAVVPVLRYKEVLNLTAYPQDKGGLALSFTVIKW